MSILSAALFAIALFLSNVGLDSAGATPLRVTPQWRVDLRPTTGTPLGVVVGRGRETQLAPQVSIWFLDDDSIAISFVAHTRGKPELEGPKELGANSYLRLEARILDPSGRVTAAPEWPTDSRYAAIIATYNGNLVTQRGTRFTLYSRDLKELTHLELPQYGEIGWSAHSSLTGKNFLLVPAGVTTGQVPWLWVDSQTLQVVHSWQDVHSGALTITDERVAMVSCGWVYDCEPKVVVKELGGNWKAVSLADRRNRSRPQFVSDNLLFLSGNPRKLIDTSGQVIFMEDTPSEGAAAVPSAGGSRFVLPIGQIKGAVGGLDIAGHWVLKKILVYDMSSRGRCKALEVTGPKVADAAQFALSPDGLKLAVLSNGFVELFKLPPLPRVNQ